MSTDTPKSEDPVFGLTARFRSGLDRNVVDTVYADEVFRLIYIGADNSNAQPHSISRLRHFGFVDDHGRITKAGRAFLKRNALAILGVVTNAVLREEPEGTNSNSEA